MEDKITAYMLSELSKAAGLEVPQEIQLTVDSITYADALPYIESGSLGQDWTFKLSTSFSPSRTPQEIAVQKGLKLDSEGNSPVALSLTLDSRNEFSKAFVGGNKGKRLREDYHPDEAELEKINSLSNVDLEATDCYVFTLTAANMDYDSQRTKFSKKALESMASLCVDKPLMKNHDHTAENQLGKIFDAFVKGEDIFQKVYILNTPENSFLLKNIFSGIYNKVSVGGAAAFKDVECDLCQKSIFSMACSHEPGETTMTYKDLSVYFETSIVAIPAQKQAGIRRSQTQEEVLPVEKSEEETPVEDEKVNNDRISNESLPVGDSNVSEEILDKVVAPEAPVEEIPAEAPVEKAVDLTSTIAELTEVLKSLQAMVTKQAEEIAKVSEDQATLKQLVETAMDSEAAVTKSEDVVIEAPVEKAVAKDDIFSQILKAVNK